MWNNSDVRSYLQRAAGCICLLTAGLSLVAGCNTMALRLPRLSESVENLSTPVARSQPAHNQLAPGQLAHNQPSSGSNQVIAQVSHDAPLEEASTSFEGHFSDYESASPTMVCEPQDLSFSHNGQLCGPVGACGTCANCLVNQAPCFDPQEYLFDGGDREPATKMTAGGKILGIESEDTVAHYEMLDGQICVAATNRVAIYAPRFGAVRKISGTKLAERSIGPKPILAPVGPNALVEAGLANSLALPVGPKGEESVKLIDAFRDRNRGIPAESVLPAIPVSDAHAPLVNLNFFRTGRLEEKETAVLGRLVANSQTWTVPESLAVAINGQAAHQSTDSKGAQEIYLYEIPPGGCSLRICKAASHTVAEPGDIILFSIRFDNVGPIPVKKAVIQDSLSTRLEYIDGSQQSSLKTKFTTEENEAGSSVLKWEIDSQLKTGEGGTIQFRCRVR